MGLTGSRERCGQRGITIEAKSLESAQGLYAALSAFGPQLTGARGQGYRVTIDLARSERQIVAILDALEEHVRQKAGGLARVEVDGRRYTMRTQEPSEDGVTDVPAP
jgi:hypothetical protein